MAGFTNYLEQKIMDYVFGGASFPAPANLFFGIHVGGTAPDLELGTGIVEPVGMNYARVQVTNNATNFPASTQIAGEAEKHNANPIAFLQASGAWGTASHWFISDALTGGNVFTIGTLTNPKTVSSGDTPSFASSTISMTLD